MEKKLYKLTSHYFWEIWLEPKIKRFRIVFKTG